jgi:hypothetical protein
VKIDSVAAGELARHTPVRIWVKDVTLSSSTPRRPLAQLPLFSNLDTVQNIAISQSLPRRSGNGGVAFGQSTMIAVGIFGTLTI